VGALPPRAQAARGRGADGEPAVHVGAGDEQSGVVQVCLVWEKDNGTNFFNAKWQPFKVHEDVLIFGSAATSYSPRGSMIYNPQTSPGKPYKAVRNQAGRHRYHASPAGDKQDNPGFRYPRSVLRFNSERGRHETQKPLGLFEYLIRTYSNPGDLVLDNTMGSGTTLIACLNTGRRGIGIEKTPRYSRRQRARIDGALRVTGKAA
jgi:hypothetical protein